MKVALLLTGNELMTGDTVDSNSSAIAQALSPAGFDVVHKITIGDDIDLLVRALAGLCDTYSVVIINGGLGPTVDDLTAAAMAKLTGQALVENQQALDHLTDWCQRRNLALNQANLKQALLPYGANIIANSIGSAVGIEMKFGNALLLATPGVPGELRAMLKGPIISSLKAEFPAANARLIRRLRVFGMGESTLQQRVDDQIADWPAEVTLGFRSGLGALELKLEVDSKRDLDARDWSEQQLRAQLGDYIFGENDQTLAEVVVSLLREKGCTATFAESCTGGTIASELTAVAGASAVFEAGFVTYSNAMKQQLLGVDAGVLEDCGAVSEEVVRAMAKGALTASGADYVVAVSGIAGPSGGTEDKPVGTVWIAWGGSREGLSARVFYLPLERRTFQQYVAMLSLDMLRRLLLGIKGEPRYFNRKTENRKQE